jgi:hypothetical protein
LKTEILTEAGRIKAVNKFKYLEYILEKNSTNVSEVETRIRDGRIVGRVLNFVLYGRNTLNRTKNLFT